MRALMILLGASVLVRPVAGEEGKVDTVVVGPRPLVAEVTTDRPFYDLGDTVYILLKVHNFGHDEVKLTFPSSRGSWWGGRLRSKGGYPTRKGNPSKGP